MKGQVKFTAIKILRGSFQSRVILLGEGIKGECLHLQSADSKRSVLLSQSKQGHCNVFCGTKVIFESWSNKLGLGITSQLTKKINKKLAEFCACYHATLHIKWSCPHRLEFGILTCLKHIYKNVQVV